MNIQSNSPDHDEAQWQAQEQARLAVRNGGANNNADAIDLRVARALRQAPPIGLPINFAAQVAGLARTQASNSSLFEQRMLRVLLVLFGVSALVTVAWFGRSWPADLAAILPGGSEAASWSMAAALCLLCNWALALLRRQHAGRDTAST